MWTEKELDIIRRIAYRNYQEKSKLGIKPRSEFERKSFEEGDWLSAEVEYRLFHKNGCFDYKR